MNILKNGSNKDNNGKPVNIIDKKEEIDTDKTAKILLKYLNKLKK